MSLNRRRDTPLLVGIATNKILSKLVGDTNKPKNQTTIMPPYESVRYAESTIAQFLDVHDIGKIPGIGFKLSHKIRESVLGREPEYADGLIYGGTKESVTVFDVRTYPGMGPEQLENILGGAGSQKGIGGKIWGLIHGIDETEVEKAKRVPSQISQEGKSVHLSFLFCLTSLTDSYMKYLHSFDEAKRQLHLLGERLIRRMHMDLLEDEEYGTAPDGEPQRRWMAHPRTLRLTTRPRLPPGPDGIRARTFQRISRSAAMPNFVFNLNEPPLVLADKLVEEALVPMFRKLHHEKAGWNLSLINVAATNMAEAAADNKDSEGRDIGRMFRQQDEVLKDFKVTVLADSFLDSPASSDDATGPSSAGKAIPESEHEISVADEWDSETSDSQLLVKCDFCQSTVPAFALSAHRRYHELSN